MSVAHQPGDAPLTPAAQPAHPPAAPAAARRLGALAVISIAGSGVLMVATGLAGQSLAVPRFTASLPWPPYSGSAHLSDVAATALTYVATGLGGLGLVAGLLAVRRGWRPRPRRLIIGSLLAVVTLTLLPPVGSTDMLDYAIYGRIAALGHNPYLMTPAQLARTGDPVARFDPPAWRDAPSVYGPLGTLSEQFASGLAGPSTARTIFWLKLLNALAFLAVALALDWLLGADPAARARALLLWTANPLMWWAVLAGGHIDALAAAAGFLGLLCLRRLGVGRGLAAGLLIGAATAVKAPFAIFLLGPLWAAWRSPRTLAAVGLGTVAVVLPSYLLTGRAAASAVVSRAGGVTDGYQPWQLLTRVLNLNHPQAFTNELALGASVVLAAIFLWRLKPGSLSLAGMPYVQPVLAVSLAWLICSPQQRPWFDAMIFPLVAVLPATRLDWLVVLRAFIATVAQLPGVTYDVKVHPHLLGVFLIRIISHSVVPLALAAVAAGLLWLCVTQRWTAAGPGQAPAGASEGADSWARTGETLNAQAATNPTTSATSTPRLANVQAPVLPPSPNGPSK